MKKEPPMWRFKKVGDEWKASLNGDFTFFMYQTHGLSAQDVNDYVESLPNETRIKTKLVDWIEFSKNINLNEIREKNEKISQIHFKIPLQA